MTTQTNETSDNATAEFARIVSNFRSEAWKEIGRVDAEALGSDLLECGYSNPTSSSTAWDDRRPTEADELYRADGNFELDDDEAELRRTLLDEARTAYNDGFNEAEQEAEGKADAARRAALGRAGQQGWRVCVFGLPGSNAHVARVAEPGTANDVSAEIYNPGPVGPYDSAILTPTDADGCRFQDGTAVYADEVEEILSRAD